MLLQKYNNRTQLDEVGVETNDTLVGRALTFLREVSVAHPSENVLVVSHGGIIRALLLHLAYATDEEMASGSVDNLAYVKIQSDGVDFFVRETSGVIITRKPK